MSEPITRDNARRLAVAYNAYLEASDKNDLSGIIVWGRILGDIQTATDIVLQQPDTMARRIAEARAARNAEADYQGPG